MTGPPPFPKPCFPEITTSNAFLYCFAEDEEWPCLLQKHSWTLSVPQRDFYKYSKPSETIGKYNHFIQYLLSILKVYDSEIHAFTYLDVRPVQVCMHI